MLQGRFSDQSLWHLEREMSNKICTGFNLDEFAESDRRFSF
jgi:hypothetical protein